MLEPESVAGFVAYLSALDGAVSVTDCSSNADGPSVVITSCSYEAPKGLLRDLGIENQTGRLFGFIVGGRVAGIAASGTYDDAAWERVERWAGGDGSELGMVGSEVNAYSAEAARQLLTVLATLSTQPQPR